MSAEEPRRLRLIVNPVAGGGRAPQRAVRVLAELHRAGVPVDLVRTASRSDAAHQTEIAGRDGAVAVAVGGDGMCALVAQAAVATGTAMSIIPGGRGNDFARQLGIDGEESPDATAARLIAGRTRHVDVIETAVRIVVGSVYTGVDAIASRIIDDMRLWPSRLQYQVAAVRAIGTFAPRHYLLEIDGEHHEFRAATVVVANSGFYGSGMRIAPSAAVDDGLLDVVVIGTSSRWKMIRALPTIYDGRHVERPDVTVLRGRRIAVDTRETTYAYADGDPLEALPAVCEVRPGALLMTGV